MKNINSKNLETERLYIKIPTMEEQYELWNILRQEEVNKYYFPTPDRIFSNNNLKKDNIKDLKLAREIFMKELNNWDRQKPFYEKKIESINSGDNSQKFTWSIFLKNGEVIGQITAQPSNKYPDNPEIRDVGWFINPKYQGKGYASEAAKEVLRFMFEEVQIEKIITSAAIINPASWKIMEKLGFERYKEKDSTYINDDIILKKYCYYCTNEMFLKKIIQINNLDKYMNQNQTNPEYLFHGSPLLLEKLEPREAHDSYGISANIDKAVFTTSSFITASAYAFKDTIKKLSNGLDWDFIVRQNETLPIMEMSNVITNDDIEGYIYVFKNDNLFKNEPLGSNQYKYYEELFPIDIIKIKYKDYKKYYSEKIKLNVIENRIKYYELLMTYEDTSKHNEYELPKGYHYEFYKPGDELEWVNIHIKSGEFTSIEQGLKYFHDFYDSFINELTNRCIFIVRDDTNEKVGTATISLLKEKEYGYAAAVDWVAIKKAYQGMNLSKPLISRFIKLANELGHDKIILHTQTNTWLAAKLYLDFGFEPFNMKENEKGWKILKKITNHSKLNNIEDINTEEIYDRRNILIYEQLKQIHGEDFNYSVWYKNGLHNVYVYANNQNYEYEYYEKDNEIILEEIKSKKYKK